MNKVIKTLICFALIIATALAVYFGAYAPFKKSKLYLSTIRMTRAGGSMSSSELIERFDRAFQFNSPIGDEELFKFYARFITDLIRNEAIDKEAAVELAKHAENYAFEGYFFHDLNMAQIYNNLFGITRNRDHLEKSEEYLLSAYETAPKVPQALEGLMINYATSEERDKLEDIADKILEIWPDHPAIKKNL